MRQCTVCPPAPAELGLCLNTNPSDKQAAPETGAPGSWQDIANIELLSGEHRPLSLEEKAELEAAANRSTKKKEEVKFAGKWVHISDVTINKIDRYLFLDDGKRVK